MIIVPLGVASATPTAKRHLSSVALWRDGRVYLFDCGENAQMRALQAGLKRSKIDYIFISHMDGDHFFGLPGLISTMQLQRRENVLNIIGPEGLKEFLEAALKAAGIELTFEIVFKEFKDGFEHEIVVDDPEFYIEARPLEHKNLCVGYRFQEKDKPGKVDAAKAESMGITEDWQYKKLKAGEDVELENGTVVASSEIVGEPKKGDSFAYVTDTLFSVNALKLAYKATILYHEATFDQNLKDKAEETFHSTAEDAATIAHKAEVQRLVISHFSARYTNQFVLLKEARKIFPDTWVATELRPIMTDPEHERGIIKAKIQIDTTTPEKGNYSRSGYKGGGGRGKYFRPRKRFDQDSGGGYRGGGGGRGGYDNRGRGPSRPYDNRGGGSSRPYDNRGGGGRPYDNRGGRPYDNRSGGSGGGFRRDYDDRGGSRPYDNRGGGRPYDNRSSGSSRPYDDRGSRPYDNRGPREWDNRDNRDNRGAPPRDYDNRNRRFENRDTRDTRDSRDDRFERRNRDTQSRDRNNTGKDFDKDMDQSKLPIKPRTPYDDFDRF
ncbi:MAG: ribonuclease Z [Balneolales bacterium]|nr:ribonuclease Z [Balneolales bacterium]